MTSLQITALAFANLCLSQEVFEGLIAAQRAQLTAQGVPEGMIAALERHPELTRDVMVKKNAAMMATIYTEEELDYQVAQMSTPIGMAIFRKRNQQALLQQEMIVAQGTMLMKWAQDNYHLYT